MNSSFLVYITPYHNTPTMSTESSATQTIIESLEKALAGVGILDQYNNVKNSAFPDKSVLSAANVLYVIANMNSHTAQRYVPLLTEAAADERNALLFAELRAISDKLDRVSSLLAATAVENPTTLPEDNQTTEKPSDVAKPMYTKKDIEAAFDSLECKMWRRKVGHAPGGTCSFLVHTKQYGLAEFLIMHEDWFSGASVSAQLAVAGDIDGIKYLHNHSNKSWYNQHLVIETALCHGHLHILRWLAPNHSTDIQTAINDKQWQSAVSNGHLNVIQWMFIELPEDAKKMSAEIFAFATAENATGIVEWMQTMGLTD